MSRPAAAAHGAGAALPEPFIAAVRERARISDLLPAAELRRCGAIFLTTCPWHEDRHPSLTVHPGRNRVHCFVCNRGTDAIGWLQDRQGLTFQEAVLELAGRYGIPAPAVDPAASARLQAEQRERQRLLHWRAGLWQRFQEELAADLAASGPASRYLQQRGLSADTARQWRLGLHQGRLMLPICDGKGRCCGFSGRSVPCLDASGSSTEATPKYRNSRADALFRRQELVFGLDQAAATIRRSGDALLVEGPLDVVQLHQGGFSQAVAALGTSLCPGQRQRLQRAGARRLVIAFDGDPAGVAACGRLIAELRPLAISGALELAVLPLPDGQDPDGLLRQEGDAAFRLRLAAAVHWLQWELDQLLAPALAAPTDLAVLQRCDHQAAQLLAQLPAGALRHRAEQRLQQALGAVPHAPLAAPVALEPRAETPPGSQVVPMERQRAERRALRLYLCSAASRELLEQLQLHDPLCRQAMDCLQQLRLRLVAAGELTGDPDAPADPLPALAQALCPQLDPALSALLEGLLQCGPDVRRLLRQQPQPELQAVLEVLEPGVEENNDSVAEEP